MSPLLAQASTVQGQATLSACPRTRAHWRRSVRPFRSFAAASRRLRGLFMITWSRPRTKSCLFGGSRYAQAHFSSSLQVRYGGLACMSAVLGIYLWPHPSGGLAVVCDTSSHSTAQFTTPWQNRLQWELAPLLQFTTFWAVEIILQLRVYALWGSRFARYNASVFLVMICAMFALWADWSTAPSRCDQPFPTSPADFSAMGTSPAELGCSMFPLYWAPGLVYELWLVSLALLHLRKRVLRNDILSVVIQDSVIYFLLIAAVMLVHLSLSFVGLGRYAVSFVIASHTIGGSRVVLHLRKSHYKAYDLSLNATSAPMAFALRSSISIGLVDESFFDPERL